MKNVCESCKNAKKRRTDTYCVKYGIIIYQPRIYCVALERDNGKVQKQEDRG